MTYGAIEIEIEIEKIEIETLIADWLKSADLTRSTPTFKWEECRLAELNDAKR